MTKIFLLAITLLISTISVLAQGQEGVKVLEGNFSYSLSKHEDFYFNNYNNPQLLEYESQSIVVNPNFGWFVSHSSVLGIGLGYEYYNNKRSIIIPSESKEWLFFFNPYFRNYQKITDKLFFNTTIDFALGFGKETEDEDLKMNMFMISLTARPGLTYFLSEKWALKTNFGSLYFRRSNKKITESTGAQIPKLKETNFGINFSMESFRLGIGYYF